MQEFSLELISEQIHYGKTKAYFEEVLSSYNNRNYRSSVVMLWSVAICDIIYKLQNLIDLYDDAAAKDILQEVTNIQNEDYKSSAWEIKLLKEVHERTLLLDSSEYENLRYLQKQRHLSAHPVLNSERELHSPNKETVRSLLRNTLEGLLVKPPFYTQKIRDGLLEDIAESSDFLNSPVKVKQYLESRYLSRTKPIVEISLFRSFWKLVFKLENEDCIKNRRINFWVLELLSSRNINSIVLDIEKDNDYYSGNISHTGRPVSYLVRYLSKNSGIFPLLSKDAQIKIEHCIKMDDRGKIVGWFIKDDLNQHGDDIEEWIRSEDRPNFTTAKFDALLEIADTEEWQKKFCRIVTIYYTLSNNFSQADERFQVAIQKYISLFNEEALIDLTKRIEENDQCYGRNKARDDYKIIKNRIDFVYGKDFDYDKIPSFKRFKIDTDE